MVKIRFLSGLKEIVGQNEIEVECSDLLSHLLEDLCNRYGEQFCRLLWGTEVQGKRNPYVKILINGEDIRDQDPRLAGDETIILFLPIAGG
jgi:molybdopterin converting factor small subunit